MKLVVVALISELQMFHILSSLHQVKSYVMNTEVKAKSFISVSRASLVSCDSSPPPLHRSLTGFFGLLGVLCDVVLGASVCEHQSNPGDVATGRTSALCLREAVLHHVFKGQTCHGAFLHVFDLENHSQKSSKSVHR